jgi:CRP/FNR family cyclic AMP-dependent transcriptional regulator
MDVIEQAQRLGEIPLFTTLDESQLKLLAFTSETFSYDAGDFLFHQDEVSDGIYIVLEGNVSVLDESTDEPVVLAKKEPGALLGEMAVLRNLRRSAGVRAESESLVLKIGADRFIELITSTPSFALFVLNDISTKLADASAELAELKLQHLHPAD